MEPIDFATIVQDCLYQNNSTTITNREIRIAGELIPPPPCPMTNTTIINKKIFINGWEYKGNGHWRKTLRALWHKYF